MLDVVLHPGRDRSVRRRHPWLLSGAIARVSGDPGAGARVRVLSAEGEVLGFGHFSPGSNLAVRLLDFGKEDPGEDGLAGRLEAALARRAADPLLAGTDAVRLVNAEGDGLPGLVVDRYADVIVVRASAAGMLVRGEEIASSLRALTGASAGVARDDAVSLRREGLAARHGPLWGSPEGVVGIQESGRQYRVDVLHGQKTGFYLDQRDARDLVQSLAADRRVLDLFAYTGGFSVAAAQGGARTITVVESSKQALALARENLSHVPHAPPAALVPGDAFEHVRADGPEADLLVVDPPPLARRRSDVGKATRAYKDVLLHGLRRCAPDALVLAFACSHHVSPDLFRKVVFGASIDAGRSLQVLRTLGAPVDHPVSLDHPEGQYLNGLLLRVV